MEARFQARTTWTILFVIAFGSLVLGAVVGCASQSSGGSTQVADRSVPGQPGQSGQATGSGSGTRQADPPAAPARVARPITVEWVGDIALSTRRGLPPGGLDQGARARSAGVLRVAASGDVWGTWRAHCRVGGSSKCGGIGGHFGTCFAFQAPAVHGLVSCRALGFDVVNLANNHSLDYGYSGRGADDLGPEPGRDRPHGPARRDHLSAGSLGVRIAFLGFAPYSVDT